MTVCETYMYAEVYLLLL